MAARIGPMGADDHIVEAVAVDVDRSGLSVSGAGDINGDGFDDVIVGAHRADPGGNSAAGESYVV
ncbi:MAG: integrin alpha, partial [Pseudomonadota bacterium]